MGQERKNWARDGFREEYTFQRGEKISGDIEIDDNTNPPFNEHEKGKHRIGALRFRTNKHSDEIHLGSTDRKRQRRTHKLGCNEGHLMGMYGKYDGTFHALGAFCSLRVENH